MKKILFTIAILTTVLIFGCKKTSTTPTNTNTTTNTSDCGSLTLTIDGVTKTLANQKISLTKMNSNSTSQYSDNQIYYDFQIWGEVDGGNLAIDITNYEWQSPTINTILSKIYYNNSNLNTNSCKTVNNHPYCQEFLTVFDNKSDQGGPWATALEIDAAYPSDKSYLEITKMDGTTKKASGNFEIKLFRDSQNDTISTMDTKIIKGSFTNLCYITQ